MSQREVGSVSIVFKVLRVYQPGGLGERTTLLKQLVDQKVPAHCWVSGFHHFGHGGGGSPGFKSWASNHQTLFSSMAPIKDTVKVKALDGDNGGTKDEGKPRDGRGKIKENGEGKGTKDAKEAKNDKSEGKNGKGDQKGAASDKPVCRYFLSDTGCKKGQKCPFPHDEWNWNIQAGPVLVLWFDPTYEARMSSEGCPKGEEGDWRGCEVQGWKRQRKRWRSWNSAW